VNKHLVSIWPLLMLACASTVHAQQNEAFPGLVVDQAAIQLLEKAEQFFEVGNFKRAYFIYRHQLAPIGDKYAQYMVGYMNLTGQGTDADRVAAAAWYRLAAERGTTEFVQVYKQLIVSLTPEQMEEHDTVYRDLRKRFGDLPLVMRAVRQDYEILRQSTGSRLGPGTSPVMVVDMRNRGVMYSGADYYRRVEARLKSRLELIDRYTDIEIIDFDVDRLDIDAIEEQVSLELEGRN
jgi:hypothetical protein